MILDTHPINYWWNTIVMSFNEEWFYLSVMNDGTWAYMYLGLNSLWHIKLLKFHYLLLTYLWGKINAKRLIHFYVFVINQFSLYYTLLNSYQNQCKYYIPCLSISQIKQTFLSNSFPPRTVYAYPQIIAISKYFQNDKYSTVILIWENMGLISKFCFVCFVSLKKIPDFIGFYSD